MHESEKWKWSLSAVSDSSRPHGMQPTRLLRPWDFPGKSTGVGSHRYQPLNPAKARPSPRLPLRQLRLFQKSVFFTSSFSPRAGLWGCCSLLGTSRETRTLGSSVCLSIQASGTAPASTWWRQISQPGGGKYRQSECSRTPGSSLLFPRLSVLRFICLYYFNKAVHHCHKSPSLILQKYCSI